MSYRYISGEMNGRYILDENHKPIPEPDLIKWGQWMETADRHVKLDRLDNDIKVSTVFLGLDHNFGADGPPILFETMIFGGIHDTYQSRCCTYEEALIMHDEAVRIVKDVVINPDTI